MRRAVPAVSVLPAGARVMLIVIYVLLGLWILVTSVALLQILDDILDFSRIEAARLVIPQHAVVVDRTAAWLHGLHVMRRSSAYEVPPIEVDMPPPNRSDMPPPRLLCSRTISARLSSTSTVRARVSASTRKLPPARAAAGKRIR